jgi:hypothetical protein
MLNPDSLSKLRLILSHHNPEIIKEVEITNYEDIFVNIELLRNSIFNEQIFEKVLDILIDHINEKKRFRKNELLSILKRMKKNSNSELSPKIVRKIFSLYKELIINSSNAVYSALNNLLRGQLLEENEINWLIKNYKNSDSILNRLLKYHIKSKIISDWAIEIYNSKEIENRKSEIIGLILDYNPHFSHPNKNGLIWGVYFSHLNKEEKRKILLANLDDTTFDDIIDVASRIQAINLLENIYYENKEKMK